MTIDRLPLYRLVADERNAAIYGEGETVADLVESIRATGEITPLIVVEQPGGERFRVLSGHRRWRAAHELGLATVPVNVRTFADEWAELQTLIVENAYRPAKTTMQIGRELAAMAEIQEARRKADLSCQVGRTNTQPKRGRPAVNNASDRGVADAAEAAGTSARTVRRAIAVVRAVDQMREAGDETGATTLERVANSESISAAEAIVQHKLADRALTAIATGEAKTARQAMAHAEQAALGFNDNAELAHANQREALIKAIRRARNVTSYTAQAFEPFAIDEAVRSEFRTFEREIGAWLDTTRRVLIDAPGLRLVANGERSSQ